MTPEANAIIADYRDLGHTKSTCRRKRGGDQTLRACRRLEFEALPRLEARLNALEQAFLDLAARVGGGRP